MFSPPKRLFPKFAMHSLVSARWALVSSVSVIMKPPLLVNEAAIDTGRLPEIEGVLVVD